MKYVKRNSIDVECPSPLSVQNIGRSSGQILVLGKASQVCRRLQIHAIPENLPRAELLLRMSKQAPCLNEFESVVVCDFRSKKPQNHFRRFRRSTSWIAISDKTVSATRLSHLDAIGIPFCAQHTLNQSQRRQQELMLLRCLELALACAKLDRLYR